MADSRYFHITLGPVQGFVAQARRTRDFWAGSFILSWLSAVAMKAVQKQGGEIQFPCPDKHYLDWLEGQGTGNAPVQGGVPNRFKATRAKVPTDFDADLIVQSIQLAWRSLAERVWQEDIAPVLKNNAPQQHNTRAVWERQINHFWEISWVITDDASATNLLDRRKNWRSHFPPDEPGVKCTMMDGWQELSAEARPHAGKLRTFWEPLQDQPRNRTIAYDLRDGEHLCALAFVKRRFVHYFHKLDVDMGSLDAALPWRLKGWTLPTGVPSVAHLAATHWIETVIDRAADQGQIECLDLFQKEARSLTGGMVNGVLNCAVLIRC